MVVLALVGFINASIFTGCSLTSYIIMNFKPEVATICSKAAISLLFTAYCVFVNVPLFVYGLVFFFWVPSVCM